METSPFMDPRVLLPLSAMIISLIVWFVRLESKTSSNADCCERNEELTNSHWKEFEHHRLNQNIHFNERASQQADNANERRFQTIERQLAEINVKLDRIAGKQ